MYVRRLLSAGFGAFLLLVPTVTAHLGDLHDETGGGQIGVEVILIGVLLLLIILLWMRR